MAVVEYMMHRVDGSNRREVPGFIGDRGYWNNPADGTYIGWVDDSRDYYVPDTVTVLTRQQFIDRQLAMHAVNPIMERTVAGGESTPMSNEQVATVSGEWYDNFVTKNSQ